MILFALFVNHKFFMCQINYYINITWAIIRLTVKDGLVCDEQCSDEGCWGPGPAQCLSCKNFILGNDCLQDCTAPG